MSRHPEGQQYRRVSETPLTRVGFSFFGFRRVAALTMPRCLPTPSEKYRTVPTCVATGRTTRQHRTNVFIPPTRRGACFNVGCPLVAHAVMVIDAYALIVLLLCIIVLELD